LEIERKFLVRKPPQGWRKKNASNVVQGYFSMADKNVEIRLRRKGNEHFLTVKGGHGNRRLEEEIKISPAQFRSLWPLTRAAQIAKRRYKIPCDGRTLEMDVYQGPHRGLVTADIEFDSLQESRSFRPPAWLGTEITGQRRYANQILARHHSLSRKRART
jgi:CYTH domain-containing protein